MNAGSKCSLGSRMKGYENVQQAELMRRIPTIIRLDGKSFHTLTKGMNKPFDKVLSEAMWETAKYMCANVIGCKIAYVQSDEITLLITDYEKLNTEPWFGNNVLKMTSVSASMATLAFNKYWNKRMADANKCLFHCIEVTI